MPKTADVELKTYQGKSMTDALSKVKADLGKAAVILHTRSVKRGGVLGVGSKTVVEITATSDSRLNDARAPEAEEPKPRAKNKKKSVDIADEADAICNEAAKVEQLEKGLAATEAAVQKEVEEIRAMLSGLLSETAKSGPAPVPAELLEHHTTLISQHVAEELVRDILIRVAQDAQKISDSPKGKKRTREQEITAIFEKHLLQTIAETLPPSPRLKITKGIRPAIIALVGPTGVGKTTTIAKLAANMKIREKLKVGLITIDTYRIAAVEQLKVYANILKIPVTAVLTPADIHAAIDQMSDMDVILIDTAGRSQRDELKIAELCEFMSAAAPQQVHLVLSSTSGEQTIREAIEKFAPAGAEHLIFTKLDEAVGFGVILNVLRDAKIKLSYLTTGQSVPDDIEPGAAQRMAQLILHGHVGKPQKGGKP